jgi:hypothetical protein
MENLSPAMIWAVVAGVAGAIVLLANAGKSLAEIVKAFKAPNTKQDARLTALENWRTEVDTKLDHDLHSLDSINSDNRVTQRALLALLDHGIDGNNIKQMQDAKEELQNRLINR